ncbi:MAG: hypothetical protein WCC27_20090 [Acidobacteriaceae bacterium]
MNRIVAVVFKKPSQAIDGRDALKGLDLDESITLYGYAIVTRQADRTVTVSEQYKHRHPHRTPSGAILDSVVAMLSRPLKAPEANQPILGVKPNLDNLQVTADFIYDASHAFTPGEVALLADIDEEWTTWLDLRMEELGGVVFRCPLEDVEEAIRLEEIASLQAELAKMKAEHARAGADLRGRLFEKMNALDTKIQQQLESAKKHREAAETTAENKADELEKAAQRGH